MRITKTLQALAVEEPRIIRAYSRWYYFIMPFVPLAIAVIIPDPKWMICAGITLILYTLYTLEAHLFDLCARLRRTNLILAKVDDDDEEHVSNGW